VTELLAAFLGAIAAGGFQFFMAWKQRKQDRRSALVAIASEVDAVCRLVQHQHYLESVEGAIQGCLDGTFVGRSLVVDIRADYFTVFNALAPRLGEQEPEHVRDIVRFYAYCKSAIDSLRPDGPHADPDDIEPDDLLANFVSLRALLKAMLTLGDSIRQFPGEPIASNFAPWPGQESEERLPLRAATPRSSG